MASSNISDANRSWKCTECTNYIQPTGARGRPRVTCSEACAKVRSSLKRRNQGDRRDPNSRHTPTEELALPPPEAPATAPHELVSTVRSLSRRNRELRQALERANKQLVPRVNRRLDTELANLIQKANSLWHSVDDAITQAKKHE